MNQAKEHELAVFEAALQLPVEQRAAYFSMPSGISEGPEPESCAMSRRSTVSVTPSARLSVRLAALSSAMRPSSVRPSFVSMV